jgi:hypothetical protein
VHFGVSWTPLLYSIPFFFVEGFYNFIRCFNTRSLYMSGSLTAAARELARYKSDLVVVQEVRWDKRGTV